jgi:hypothetical protein
MMWAACANALSEDAIDYTRSVPASCSASGHSHDRLQRSNIQTLQRSLQATNSKLQIQVDQILSVAHLWAEASVLCKTMSCTAWNRMVLKVSLRFTRQKEIWADLECSLLASAVQVLFNLADSTKMHLSCHWSQLSSNTPTGNFTGDCVQQKKQSSQDSKSACATLRGS